MRVRLTIAVLVGVAVLLRWRSDAPPGELANAQSSAGSERAPMTATATPMEPEVRTDRKVPRPLHRPSGARPGSRRLVAELPAVDRGIPLPDGRLLPFLNGMTWAPPVQRNQVHGLVPPVVAIVVDAEGFEWYEHADGSMTTSMYQEVILPGETYWDPTTKHSVPKPAEMIRRSDGK